MSQGDDGEGKFSSSKIYNRIMEHEERQAEEGWKYQKLTQADVDEILNIIETGTVSGMPLYKSKAKDKLVELVDRKLREHADPGLISKLRSEAEEFRSLSAKSARELQDLRERFGDDHREKELYMVQNQRLEGELAAVTRLYKNLVETILERSWRSHD